MTQALWIALGTILGSVARYWITLGRAEHLLTELGGYGIVRAVAEDGITDRERLLAEAEAMHADWLMMSAYPQKCLIRWVLDGVTRMVLQSAESAKENNVRADALRPPKGGEGDVPMEHLDIARMLAALRDRPGEFSLVGCKLHYRPSRQSFSMAADRRIIVELGEEHRIFSVEPEQSTDFANLFDVWRAEYWIPLEISRHFAHDLRPRERVVICLRRLFLLHLPSHRDSAFILYGNCWAGLQNE